MKKSLALVVASMVILAATGAWTMLSNTPTASVTLSPTTATVYDSVPVGTLVSTATVTMSDGSTFSGKLLSSDTAAFAISGLTVITARSFTSTDDGSLSVIVSAQ